MRRESSKWTPPWAAIGQRRFQGPAPILTAFGFRQILPDERDGWIG
jgi:hypothetical protein